MGTQKANTLKETGAVAAATTRVGKVDLTIMRACAIAVIMLAAVQTLGAQPRSLYDGTWHGRFLAPGGDSTLVR